MGYILLLVSWILRIYGAILEQKRPVDTPAIFQGDTVKLILIIIWLGLLVVGSYQIFVNEGVSSLLICLTFYFLVTPTIIGFLVKQKD